jgi:hypothetical protein
MEKAIEKCFARAVSFVDRRSKNLGGVGPWKE